MKGMYGKKPSSSSGSANSARRAWVSSLGISSAINIKFDVKGYKIL
jgi:hypothetical protein